MQRLNLLAATLLLASGSIAQAVTIRNLSTSTTVFYDNFESAPTFSTANAIDNTGDYDPVAVTGSWTVGELSGQTITQVSNSSAAPDPGAIEGTKYLRQFRDATLNDNLLSGILTAPQTTNGNLVRLSTMVFIPTSANVNVRFQMLMVGTAGDANTGRAWARPDGAGNVIAVGPGFALTDTGIDYTPGVWQRWDLLYAVNGSTFTVTVAGATSAPLSSTSSGGISALYLANGSNTAGSAYFDAVPIPEPSSATLMFLAGVSLAGARRRLRK